MANKISTRGLLERSRERRKRKYDNFMDYLHGRVSMKKYLLIRDKIEADIKEEDKQEKINWYKRLAINEPVNFDNTVSNQIIIKNLSKQLEDWANESKNYAVSVNTVITEDAIPDSALSKVDASWKPGKFNSGFDAAQSMNGPLTVTQIQ